MKGRVNTGGGGGLNASVILVTAPTGSTVTCTKGGTTKTAVEKNGLWTFRGIENGEWTVRATKGGQSTSQPVNVTQFDVYRVTLAYFNATIVTTFPTDCTSVTCKKDAVTLSVPSGSLSSGSYTFSIPEVGEWMLECTNGIDSDSGTIDVTEETEYNMNLSFDLVLYSPTKDWQSNVAGYSSDNQATISEENSELKIIFKQNPYGDNAVYDAYAYSDKSIDLTKYNTAKIALRVIWGSRYINDLTIGFATTQIGKFTVSKNLGSYGNTTSPNLDDTYSLDISNLDGKYYFCMHASNGMHGLGTLYISEAIAK